MSEFIIWINSIHWGWLSGLILLVWVYEAAIRDSIISHTLDELYNQLDYYHKNPEHWEKDKVVIANGIHQKSGVKY